MLEHLKERYPQAELMHTYKFPYAALLRMLGVAGVASALALRVSDVPFGQSNHYDQRFFPALPLVMSRRVLQQKALA
jgi:hypothetical protein